MTKIRSILILMVLLIGGALFGASLEDFYATIYGTDTSMSVEDSFTAFIREIQTVNDIDNAVQLWSSYDPESCRAHLGKLYNREPGNLNIAVAWILAEQDFGKAIRGAKKLIMVNRNEPSAYQPMVMRYVFEMPDSVGTEEWTAFQNNLIKDSAYFYRFYELARDNEFAVIGKLISSMALRDLESGKRVMDQTIENPVSIAPRMNLAGFAYDPDYLALMLYYMDKAPEEEGLQDPETLFSFAESVSSMYYQKAMWQEMVDTFATRTSVHGLGLVIINLLTAYKELGRYAEAKTLLSEQSVEGAVNLLDWWNYYYPDRNGADFVNELHAIYSGDSVVDAVWLGNLDEPETKLIAARAYIEDNPEEEVGYNVLFDGWRQIWRVNDFKDPAQDSLSANFVADLEYWDKLDKLRSDFAYRGITAILEGSYYSEKATNVIAMINLRPGWIENPDMQFLLINSYFNLDDYASVMQRLYAMVDNGLVSLADLEGLESSGNAICEHEGWARLMDYARKLEDKKTVDEDQPEENR